MVNFKQLFNPHKSQVATATPKQQNLNLSQGWDRPSSLQPPEQYGWD